MSRHKVTRREFDSILAALRLSQHDSAWIADGDGMIRNIAEEHGDALTNDEIGALCEKLNWEGEPSQPDALTLLTRFVKYFEDSSDPDMAQSLYSIFSEAQDFVLSQGRNKALVAQYLNFYLCPGNVGQMRHKPYKWTMQHDCTCDDKCPKCNVAYSPYKTEDI